MDMEEAQAQAKVANGLIVASLQHPMMTHDPADIQSIIDNVSHQAGVRGMYLYNEDGALKWYGEQPPSSMAADPKGGAVPTAIQPKLPAGNGGSAFTAAVTGEQVLRQWNVIENQPRCNGCHSAQAAMLGTLVADYSITETNRQIAMDLRASVTSVLVTVLAVVLAMNVLLSRFVLDRLEQFIPVLQRYGQGNLSLRLTPHGADEIGQLATQFNHMADGLEARRRNARLYRELEDKEAARTFLLHKAIAAQEEERNTWRVNFTTILPSR